MADTMKKYGYKLRPGYGSEELLIDLDPRNSPDELQADLFRILEQAGFTLKESQGLWVNDVSLFLFRSDCGIISLSRDNWDLFFILGENNNQSDILKLDQLLFENPLFEKIIVNYSNYK